MKSNNVLQFATIALVRSANFTPQGDFMIYIKELNEEFVWDPASTATDNGTTVIAITFVATGRFHVIGAGRSGVKQITADYTISDDDQDYYLELMAGVIITIPNTLTNKFQECVLTDMTTNKSTIAGTYTGIFNQTQTAGAIGTRSYITRHSNGTNVFHWEL